MPASCHSSTADERMSRPRAFRAVAALTGLALAAQGAAPHAAGAQGSYEIEVYSTEITPQRSLLVELHSNYTFRGSDATVASGGHAPIVDDQWLAPAAAVLHAAACTSSGKTPFFQRAAQTGASFALRDLTGAPCAATLASSTYVTHES